MAVLSSTALFLKASLQAYYKFDSGALTTDSKNSYTLTNNNTVGEGTGKYAGSADFGASNTNKYFSRADALGLVGAEDFTACGWVYIQTAPTAGQQQQFIHVNINSGSINIFGSYRHSGGNLQLYMQRNKNGTAAEEVSVNYTIPLNTWTHLAYTFDGSNIKIYANAVEVASNTASGTGANPVTDLTGIGQDGGGGDLIKGMIDDWAFFKDEALVAADLALHYQDELTSQAAWFI